MSRIPKHKFVARHRYFLLGASFATMLLSHVLIFAPISLSQVRQDSKQVTLKVDNNGNAYALYNGVLSLVALGDFFEFYSRTGPTLSRNRIASGPLKGLLKSTLLSTGSRYILSGKDSATGSQSNIEFNQTSSDGIEISFLFQAPKNATYLSFNIVKVAGYLFTGAELDSRPIFSDDAKTVPVKPPPPGKHVLLKHKNRVNLKSAFGDVEVVDLNNASSILMTDMRAMPGDRHRSINFGVEGWPVVAGNTYSFKYRILISPSSDPIPKIMTGAANLSQVLNGSPSAQSALSVNPKKETLASGFYNMSEADVIFCRNPGMIETVLRDGVRQQTGFQLSLIPRESIGKLKGITVNNLYRKDLPAEGYEITVSRNGITISGADARGLLYGVHTLLSRIKNNGNSWRIQCGTVTDWPDLPTRGMCLELIRPYMRDVFLMKKYILALSRARCNLIIFLHMPDNIKAWQQRVDDGGWTKLQMREIVSYARSLQMEVWGGMTSKFTAAKFSDMDIYPGTNLYNPFNNKSYDVLFGLYDEVLKLYSPSTVLIGHDEIVGLSQYAQKFNGNPGQILAADVNKIHDWLAQRNVRTAMFGDMLLDYKAWDRIAGYANSQNIVMGSGTTHLAIGKIAKDIVILDWHYTPHPTYPTIDYFRKNGFSVLGCPWYEPVAASLMAKSVAAYQGLGIVGTDWGFWKTLSPASTTLYALLSGWNTNLEVDGNGADIDSLAAMLRNDVYSRVFLKQIPVDLKPYANTSSKDSRAGDGKGLFDLGQVLDLRAIPVGKTLMGGTNFFLNPSESENSYNVVCVDTFIESNVPSKVKMELGDKRAIAVAFLHTAFIERPQVGLRQIGEYVIRYDTGRIVKVPLIENYNITDIRSVERLRYNDWTFSRLPDVLIGSVPGWRGMSAGLIPLNLQILIWTNDYPNENIKSITLKISGPKSELALIGLTLLN